MWKLLHILIFQQENVVNNLYSIPDAPIINVSSDKVAIDANESAIFKCAAHSEPEASFTWFNGSTQLIDGGRIKISTFPLPGGELYMESIMEVSDVTAADLGNYSCRASNAMGDSVQYLELTVKSKCVCDGEIKV